MGTTQIVKEITYLEGDGSYTTVARPFSLNDADLNRAFIMVNGYFYFGDYNWNYKVNSGYENEFTYASGATWYMLYDQVGNFADAYPDVSVPSGTTYEIISFVEYPAGTTLDFTGTVLSSMGLGAGRTAPWKELIPDTVSILVNGQPIGNPQPFLNGNFDVSGITFTSEEDIVSIGYRFTYSQQKGESYLEVNWGNYGYAPYFKLVDSVTVTPTLPVIDDPYIPILTEIKEGIESIANAIGNLFIPNPGQLEDSNDFLDDMTSATDQIIQDVEEIEENTNRPSASTIVPDITVIVDQTDVDYTGYMGGITALLTSNIVLNILMLVFSLAFCSYVLFGKKG